MGQRGKWKRISIAESLTPLSIKPSTLLTSFPNNIGEYLIIILSFMGFNIELSDLYRPDLALAVLELCYQRSVPDMDGDIQPDLPLEAALKNFAADLHKYSYYIPPKYHEIFGTTVSEAVMARIQTLRLRLEVQRAVKDENWNDIAERWK